MAYRAIRNFIIDKQKVSLGDLYEGEGIEKLLLSGLIETSADSFEPEMAEQGGEGQLMDEVALSPPKKSKKKKE